MSWTTMIAKKKNIMRLKEIAKEKENIAKEKENISQLKEIAKVADIHMLFKGIYVLLSKKKDIYISVSSTTVDEQKQLFENSGFFLGEYDQFIKVRAIDTKIVKNRKYGNCVLFVELIWFCLTKQITIPIWLSDLRTFYVSDILKDMLKIKLIKFDKDFMMLTVEEPDEAVVKEKFFGVSIQPPELIKILDEKPKELIKARGNLSWVSIVSGKTRDVSVINTVKSDSPLYMENNPFNKTVLDENGTSILGNGTSILGNGTSILENGTSILGNETSIIENGTSILENETSILGNETSILENETSIIDDSNVFKEELPKSLEFDANLKNDVDTTVCLQNGNLVFRTPSRKALEYELRGFGYTAAMINTMCEITIISFNGNFVLKQNVNIITQIIIFLKNKNYLEQYATLITRIYEKLENSFDSIKEILNIQSLLGEDVLIENLQQKSTIVNAIDNKDNFSIKHEIVSSVENRDVSSVEQKTVISINDVSSVEQKNVVSINDVCALKKSVSFSKESNSFFVENIDVFPEKKSVSSGEDPYSSKENFFDTLSEEMNDYCKKENMGIFCSYGVKYQDIGIGLSNIMHGYCIKIGEELENYGNIEEKTSTDSIHKETELFMGFRCQTLFGNVMNIIYSIQHGKHGKHVLHEVRIFNEHKIVFQLILNLTIEQRIKISCGQYSEDRLNTPIIEGGGYYDKTFHIDFDETSLQDFIPVINKFLSKY